MMNLLIQNIGLFATPQGSAARCGAAQGEVLLLRDSAFGISGEEIVYVGPSKGAPPAEVVIDAGGRLVTPGLVDCHTHLVFGGWRQHEFAQKLRGVPYLDILAAGGGILSTARATRAATERELLEKAEGVLAEMLAHGVTTCEAKSGYGLSVDAEMKQLRVADALHKAGPVEIVSTFMGAHALPEEYRDRRDAYLDLVCEEMMPLVARAGLAKFCDVFCETGVFDVDEARRVLLAARAQGLGLKIHADEINPIGGSLLAADLGAVSAEHLIASGEREMAAMAAANVIGVLLPATSFYLGKPFAPAREMLNAGMAVAVASDFNPGSCPSNNLQFCMNLACLGYRLTPAEALCAVTLNAAAAIGLAGRVGSVEVGKQADIVLWDAPDLDYIFYRFGSNLVNRVIKKGKVYES
ncbi:MAG: imidazolonepropionase [Clostridiales bacterium]|nr:imidazolonepropionase [Clostridiales bacterium]